MKKSITILSGQLLDDESFISLSELCRVSHLSAEDVVEMVDYGLLEPVGNKVNDWQFPLIALRRLKIAMRLRRDLELNLAGTALLLELLEELHDLRKKITQNHHL